MAVCSIHSCRELNVQHNLALSDTLNIADAISYSEASIIARQVCMRICTFAIKLTKNHIPCCEAYGIARSLLVIFDCIELGQIYL